jgi:enoyl-CoA hydratase/carnithine racemase
MTDGGSDGPIALADGAVLVRRAPHALDVQLHRPAKRNALTAEMIEALHHVFDLVAQERPSTVVLRGVPGCFSAGADIAGYLDAPERAAELRAFTERARDLCTRISTSEAIVIAVVDGMALGGGFELVLAADLVVASAQSRFALPEVRLGLIPGWGGTQRLVRYLGPNRAKEAILTGASLSASAAHQAGIVTLLVPDGDDLDAALDSYLASLTRAPLAMRAVKATVSTAYDPGAGDTAGAALETQSLLDLFASADGQEGVRAFVEKREPRFVGH